MAHDNWTRTLFEAIDDAVFVHDEDGNILEANPAACRRLGYTRDELLHLTTRDIDDPEFAAGFGRRLQAQLQTGTMRCEGVHRTKDGRRIDVDINTSAIQLDGRPAILAVMRDITQRKQTEEVLAKQSQLLQSILDNMSDAIVVADAQGRILLFNPQAERVFGPGLVQGLYTLQATDRATELSEFPVGRCVRGESFDALELLVRHEEAPKGIWISVAGRPLRERDRGRAGDIKGGVLVCHDITARKRDERRIRAQFELARVIATDTAFDESAREILQLLCEALDFEVAVLWGTEAHDGLLWLESWSRPDAPVAALLTQTKSRLPAGNSELVAVVRQDGQARQYRVTQSAWSNSPRWQAARRAGLRGVLAFPIRTGTDTLGVLELWSRWVESHDQSLHSILEAMVNQIGQFLNRHKVEKDLLDSRALYESLVESLPQNIFRKDRTSHITFANQRYCINLNQPLSSLLGKTDFDLFPRELAQKYVDDDARIMQSGETLDTIEGHQTPDGRYLYVHVVKTPVRDADNQVVGVQGIFWDVTSEVQATQAIATSEKRYRQLTEATMDGIVVIDSQGLVALFNPAAERMFGYRADEVVGGPASTLIPGEFQQLHEQGVAHYLAVRLPDLLGQPHEFKGKRKDGSDFPVEIALSVLTDPGGGATPDQPPVQILAAVRDLTEPNKMRAFLIQNEKLASIGLLSAGVAHEINNPLAFVANNLVVLERDCKGLLDLMELYDAAGPTLARELPDLARRIETLGEQMDLGYIRGNLTRVLSRTRDGIDRVTRIIHSLRGMARTEAPRRQEVRLPDLINSSLEILHGKFKRLGVVVEQIHDPQPVVSCVPTQVDQVILNLLMNAFQAIEAARRAAGKIVIRTQRVGSAMMLEITDNGTGIRDEHRARLFDPFFTTKDVGEGTGLGLSISHHIVTAHGGRIEVDSQRGAWTRFRIYLPLKPPSNKP
jgi:PAS domain S-box-containing protein